MAPDSRRSASTTSMTLPPISSALACTCTISHGRRRRRGSRQGYRCRCRSAGFPPRRLGTSLPAAGTPSSSARCHVFAAHSPAADGQRRGQRDSCRYRRGKRRTPRGMRSARIDLRHREPGLHLILPPVVAWPSVSLYLVWRPGKGTITDRHGHRRRGPGQRRTRGSQQTPMRRGGGGWAAPTAREDTGRSARSVPVPRIGGRRPPCPLE
jgi:hypothetical protein